MVNKKDDWHHERRIGKAVKAGIKCFCGSEAYRDILEVTMNCETFPRVQRIFCPNCGLQMRSPAGNDDDFIVRQWRDISDLHQHRKQEQDRADRAVGMTDLISREAAIEEIARRDTTNGTVKVYSGLEVNAILSDLPAVDAVPVVRCRECKHAQMTYGGECKYCDFWQEDGGEALYLDGDFYCAAGERRNEHAAD